MVLRRSEGERESDECVWCEFLKREGNRFRGGWISRGVDSRWKRGGNGGTTIVEAAGGEELCVAGTGVGEGAEASGGGGGRSGDGPEGVATGKFAGGRDLVGENRDGGGRSDDRQGW